MMPSETIMLTKDGSWFHDGVEITHARTIELFFKSVLFQDGKYFLTGEKMPVSIQVEDVAYFVKAIKFVSGSIQLTLSDQSQQPLDCTTLDLQAENHLLCRLQNGAPAKFERKAYYDVMQVLTKKHGYLGLVVGDLFYPLQKVQASAPSAKAVSPAPKAAVVKTKVKAKTVVAAKAKKTVAKAKPKPKTPTKVKTKTANKKNKPAEGKPTGKAPVKRKK